MPNPTPSPTPSSNPTPAAQPQTQTPVAKNAENKSSNSANIADIKPVENKGEAAIPKKYKVKVDNQEREVEERELIENYQLRQLSDKKRSEAEKVMVEYTKLFEVLKKDPIKFMKATGIDFDNLSTSYLAKKAEEAMLDPKERELKQAKAEAEQYKKWVEDQKTKQAEAEQSQRVTQERNKIHQEIIQAIEESKDLGLPVDEELVIAIAQKMILQDKKQKPLNAKEALPKAYESTQKFLHGIASKMEGEALIKWLGPDVATKIRKHDLAQLKAKRAATQPQSGNSLIKPKAELREQSPRPRLWSEFKRDNLDTIK